MNPFQAAPDSKKKLTLFGLFLTMFGSLLVSSGNSTILPAIAADIGGVEIYPLANTFSSPISIAAMPLWGYLAARDPSLKRPLAAFSIFAGFVVIFTRAFATNIWAVIIPAILWGFVSAGLYVLGFAMIRDMYDAKKAGLFLGTMGTVQALGMLVGPFLTGALIDTMGWRVVCHVIWPFLLAGSVLVFIGVKVSKEEAKTMAANLGKFDLPGAFFLVVFLMLIILGLSTGATVIPFGSVTSNAVLIAAVIALIAFILILRSKGNAAIIPVTVLKDRNTLLLALCNFTLNFSNMAIFFFIPAYIMYVIGGMAMQAGLATTAMSILGVFLGPILGRAIAKSGNARNIMTAGTLVRIAVTLVFMFFLSPATPLVLIYAIMFIGGFYSSQTGVSFATAPQIQIKAEIRQLSNSVIQVGQGFGAGIGLSVYTLIIGGYGIVDGMKIALGLAVIAAGIALFLGLGLKKVETPS